MQLFWTLEDFAREMHMSKYLDGLNPIKLGCRLKNRRLPGVMKEDGKFKGYSGFCMELDVLSKHLLGEQPKTVGGYGEGGYSR